MTQHNIHLDTGAYALGALPDIERKQFERHLRTCPACATEVREFTAAAARLGTATPVVQPPDGLRDRVLRGVRTVRQETPPAPRPAWTDRVTRRLPAFALAASVFLAAAFGGIAWWQHDRAEDARARAGRVEAQVQAKQAELSQVLTAPDARTTTARLPGGGAAAVVVSRQRNQAVLITADMPAPPRGRVYQVWYEYAGHLEPAGLMDPERPADPVLLRRAMSGASGIGITVEPPGGSPQPTSDSVAALRFAA